MMAIPSPDPALSPAGHLDALLEISARRPFVVLLASTLRCLPTQLKHTVRRLWQGHQAPGVCTTTLPSCPCMTVVLAATLVVGTSTDAHARPSQTTHSPPCITQCCRTEHRQHRSQEGRKGKGWRTDNPLSPCGTQRCSTASLEHRQHSTASPWHAALPHRASLASQPRGPQREGLENRQAAPLDPPCRGVEVLQGQDLADEERGGARQVFSALAYSVGLHVGAEWAERGRDDGM